MKPLAKFFGAALVGALALLAIPSAQAQVGVNINIGAPAWGPQVPYGTQYYYIPEIDGYYDLYAQQYLVYDNGYWVPLPQLYGYDPYRFHPVAIAYRGREPWCQRDYYHQRYAYQPYCNYGRGGYRNGYYSNGYGRNNYPRGGYYGSGRGYNDHDRDDHGYNDRDHDGHGYGYGGGYSSGPRGGQPQYPGNGGGPRGGSYGGQQQPQQPQPGGYGNSSGSYGSGQAHAGTGNGQGNNGQSGNGNDQGGGRRHGRD